jgi:hypothetical protein
MFTLIVKHCVRVVSSSDNETTGCEQIQKYEGVSKSFLTGGKKRELQMV